jgi:tetratricopeptide (TPR) repeat protein
LLAGDQAEAVHAHAEAEDHYRTAITLARELGDQPHEAEALEKLGAAIHFLARNYESAELLERALDYYRALLDQEAELRTLSTWILAQAEFGREMIDVVVERAQEILARLEPQDEAELTSVRTSRLAAVYRNLAWAYWTSGAYEDSVRIGRRAAELARAIGDEAQLAQILFRLFISGDRPTSRDERRATLEDILAMAERTSQLAVVVTCHNMIAGGYLDAGEFALALPHMEQSIAAAEQHQDLAHLAWQLRNFAWFLFDLGDWQRARETFARAASIRREADRHNVTWQSAVMLLDPGALALVEGREEEGRQLLEEATARIAQVGNRYFLDVAQWWLAQADLLDGHAERAKRRLESCLEDTDVGPLLAWARIMLGEEAQAENDLDAMIACEQSLGRIDALRVRGLLAVRQRRWEVGSAALDEVLASARAMPWPYGEAKTLWVYGQLETARENPAAARKYFKQALAICDGLGENWYRKRIERDLACLSES